MYTAQIDSTHTHLMKASVTFQTFSLTRTHTHIHMHHTLVQPQPWNIELLGSLDFFCLSDHLSLSPQLSHIDWATKQTKTLHTDFENDHKINKQTIKDRHGSFCTCSDSPSTVYSSDSPWPLTTPLWQWHIIYCSGWISLLSTCFQAQNNGRLVCRFWPQSYCTAH